MLRANKKTQDTPTPPIVTTQEIMAQRSQSFAYGTKSATTASATTTIAANTVTTTAVKRKSNIYSALLSKIAIELRQRITLADHIKDDIEYKNTFDGKQVVVSLVYPHVCERDRKRLLIKRGAMNRTRLH